MRLHRNELNNKTVHTTTIEFEGVSLPQLKVFETIAHDLAW